MKFTYAGREGVDRSRFAPNKKKGSFLERFKGRVTQMNKEGHLSVVKNTREPIKPSYEKPIQSYNNEYSAYNQPETKKTNYDALSPMKRSNTISRKEGIILLVIFLIF